MPQKHKTPYTLHHKDTKGDVQDTTGERREVSDDKAERLEQQTRHVADDSIDDKADDSMHAAHTCSKPRAKKKRKGSLFYSRKLGIWRMQSLSSLPCDSKGT